MRTTSLFVSLAAVAAVAGCASVPEHPAAEAKVAPTAGNTASGVVRFFPEDGRLRVTADISGLTPGAHGFHVHDKGDCSAPDGSSAGGHFNPGGKAHGHPDSTEHHAGDLPQLLADAAGVAHLSAYSSVLSVGGLSGDVLGRSIVIHAASDDFKTQPAGNSGARLACGVIVAR
ncbi:superoxide dismutase family protein [Rhodocyclus tenuis]|uniref:superoxide dismutase family protein n=1 Tax=Rhodocyclus tenuis TaxID=1066 RepID=UPI001906CE3B|nr:superoxide dismutase family protein [Rhodocyclus tenuis]MBK1681613.1 superoxide dismutase [Rhodocyclus tenuis]